MTGPALALKISFAWWLRWLLIPALRPIGVVACLFGERGQLWAMDRVLALANRGLRCEVKETR